MRKSVLISVKPLFLITLLLLLVVSSCKNSSQLKIGFLIPQTVGFRWPIDQQYIEKAASDKGIEVITRSAENDENLQLKQAKELLEMGVDVLIVVAANSNTAAAIVRDAHESNVPVIGYDRIITNSDLDYLVTFEGAMVGNLMVDYAISKKPEGNYVMLWGDAGDVNAILIKDAQEATLKPYVDKAKINIVYKTFVEDWSADNAYHFMKNVLDFSQQKIDAVITSNDGMALGALKALEEKGYSRDVILTGQDATLDAIKAIHEGRMTLTVYKSIGAMASCAFDLAYKLAKGEKIPNIKSTLNNGRKDVPVLYLKPVAVTKNNIRETVIADKFYTEQQVFGNK
jgi:D-xylose transport system substrate-binding protein